jgi:succinyl-diaminopimelate desuccinylase
MSDDARLASQLAPHLSRERCRERLVALVQVPSPQTALLEAEPALRRFIETAVEPQIRALGANACRYDSMGNLIASFGVEQGPSLMFLAHAMNHPPTSMANPYGGEIQDGTPFGLPGEVVRGRGASEQKGTLAAMLHALEALVASEVPLAGKLYFVCCVSGETGKLDAIRNVVEVENVQPDIALLYGNGLKLQLGNRGRIDMHIVVNGVACHSSRPHEGCNAITGALEIVRRLLTEIDLDRAHPHLGRAALTINGIRSFPDATHTLQGRCEIAVDRRLLPGEDPDEAAAEIERVAMSVDGTCDPVSGRPFAVEVTKGPFMYPSLVGSDAPAVQALSHACKVMLGREPEPFYAQSAFDQGYLNHVGISTVNFGPGEQALAHTESDVASVDKTFDAARVFAFLAAHHLQPKA